MYNYWEDKTDTGLVSRCDQSCVCISARPSLPYQKNETEK